jgi:serine/threonine protein kinase
MSQHAPCPGTMVGGRYRLEQMLVQGGMGSVWRAHHISLNAPVAIKFISPLIVEDEEALGRFMLEAQSAAALRSSHIVQVFDFGIDDGTPFIAMELLVGESLAERLRRVGTLSPVETGRVLSQVARGIQHAHTTGIVHRDLKPDNIFLTVEGDHEVAKVLDFGIAKATTKELRGHASAETRAGTLLGSPYYVSPEQAEGERDIDHRSDLWALGIVAFECLTGKRPFEADSLASLLVRICTHPSPRPSDLAKVPAGFDAWFLRATSKDRSRRFQSARELVEDYARMLTSGTEHASEIGWVPGNDGPDVDSKTLTREVDINVATTISPTPQQSTVNDGALAVTPTLVPKPRWLRHWPTLLGAVGLLALAVWVVRVIRRPDTGSPTRHSAHAGANLATAVVSEPVEASAPRQIHDSASDQPAPLLQKTSLEVTPVASGSEPPRTRREPPVPGVVRTNDRRQAQTSSSTQLHSKQPADTTGSNPIAPLTPTTTKGEDLFRKRKLPGEEP